ncbi:flagellin lysine-N-methylase [Oscillibacter sp. MSJ-2]|uniref:Flagellin lysine-N-methylase n=1 Tax=Dysosmobacter acutus TaxID=2841504 RepID=A0ABS6FAN5_9FIRM|nr:flagellin lysine-N-methylase [Dysosmobacter acutus]MBU5627353.1 flagellin lysine-N-methylase [Dysosmobacter acutus]
MIRCVPDYYDDFRCLAERCPHSCCIGWEVMIDNDTAAFYQSVPGELGRRLRQALQRDEDNAYCFPLRGGRCPFLERGGLCEIYRRLGESHTSFICRTHPRFFDDYGSRREESLCASCPEVTRLVLSRDALFAESEWAGPSGPAPSLLNPLLRCRGTAFAILRREGPPLREKLGELLLFANEVQSRIDEGEEASLPQFAEEWTAPGLPVPDEAQRAEVWRRVLELLRKLDCLGDDWRSLLQTWPNSWVRGLPVYHAPEPLGQRTAVYFLFRYWLHSVWDGDVLSRAELCVLATAVAGSLNAPYPDCLRMFCREVEHCAENLDSLQDAFCHRFSLMDLLSLI